MILRAHFAVAAAVVCLSAPPASAQEPGAPDVARSATVEPSPVHLTALTAPARLSGATVTTITWASYDGASQVPSVSAGVEARLLPRLALAVGVESSSDPPRDFTLRPLVALRLQLLDQRDGVVDATASAGYRQDRFEADGGFFQGTLALGRTFDRLQVVLNLVVGVDPEGDDLEGEVRAAGLVEVSQGVHLGVDGCYRHDLGSSDRLRGERDRVSSEQIGGATAAFVRGGSAVMVEAGVARVTATSTRTGPIALAGYSATF